MDHAKIWTQQQDQLRKTLSTAAHFDQAIQLFLSQHAAVHTREVSGSQGWSLAEEVLTGLADARARTCLKPGTNSIAWLLWHITRIEDMTINFLVLERPQVISQADWEARLSLPSWNCGASMDDSEVAALSAQVSFQALKAYRDEIGRGTRTAVTGLQASQLKEIVPDASVQKLVEEGSISQKGHWLAEYYLNRTKGFFLTRTATSHNFIHLREALRIRAKIEQAENKRTAH